jgi:hypothetical protein
MLTSPSGVFLSGDFRLTSRPGAFSDNLNTQKLVPVVKFGWSALVSFAGVGRTSSGLDVGEWLAEELAAIDMHEDVSELERRLLGANTWLRALGPQRHHIFSAVGFNGARPFAMVISNFLDEHGQWLPTVGDLSCRVYYPDRPEVFVRGWESAVMPDEVTGLLQVLQAGISARDLQLSLATINRAAANRSPTISPECVTGHLLPVGTGEVTPHGISDTVEYMPGFVKRSLLAEGTKGFLCRTNAIAEPLPPRWVGMTWTVRDDALVMMHVIRNVQEPMTQDQTSELYWKIII